MTQLQLTILPRLFPTGEEDVNEFTCLVQVPKCPRLTTLKYRKQRRGGNVQRFIDLDGEKRENQAPVPCEKFEKIKKNDTGNEAGDNDNKNTNVKRNVEEYE